MLFKRVFSWLCSTDASKVHLVRMNSEDTCGGESGMSRVPRSTHSQPGCPALQTGEEGEEVMADFKCKLYRCALCFVFCVSLDAPANAVSSSLSALDTPPTNKIAHIQNTAGWSPVHGAFACRYDQGSGEWKERGVGPVKLLRHKDNDRIRLLMRQDKTLKIRANHIGAITFLCRTEH